MPKHEMTPEQRAEAGRRMAEGRARKKEAAAEHGDGKGVLLDTPLGFADVHDALTTISMNWLGTLNDGDLLAIAGDLRAAMELASQRQQTVEARRSEQHCDVCKKVLPGGRFAGEIIVRDEITQELRPWRACTESCYRELDRVASVRRGKGAGLLRGSIAI